MTGPGNELFLNPERAAQGARDLTDAGSDFLSQQKSIGPQIQSLSSGPPWGADEIGAAFESKYRQIESQVLTGWEKLGTYLEDLGESASHAVQQSTATEEANDAIVQSAWRDR